jgi:Ohr subfamily peroxiredoxin
MKQNSVEFYPAVASDHRAGLNSEEIVMTVLYTAETHTSGGRQGESYSSDGNLDIQLTPPGATGTGTNPEQLFAAGWSACFIGAMGLAAAGQKVTLPAETAVDAQVDLLNTDGAYSLQARLNVSVPGVDREVAQAIVDAAHQTCPYSKATRGNIPVTVTLA